MSLVFQNIDSPPPPSPASVYPQSLLGGRTHSLGREGGGGSIFGKTPDIGLASYSIISLRSLGLILINPAPSKRFDTYVKYRGKSLIFTVLWRIGCLFHEVCGKG